MRPTIIVEAVVDELKLFFLFSVFHAQYSPNKPLLQRVMNENGDQKRDGETEKDI